MHIWDGQIEAHFHFFLVISVLSLYEDWLPFGLAFAYVLVHHGLMGAVSPESIYNHPGAIGNPWTWALIHGLFVSGAGIAGVVAWRFNEATRAYWDHQSLHDPLTGLPNRVLFGDRLEVALARTRRTRGSVDAVMFLDLDDFKIVNDSLGHQTGDAVLVEVAHRLDGLLRAQDTIARFGGDEFTVLVEGLDSAEAALRVAEDILTRMSEPVHVDFREVKLSASVGVVVSRGEHSAEEILRDADAAMYRAKDRGRARIEVFGDELREQLVARLEFENDLNAAIRDGQFKLHYQPKVRIESGEVVGVEALVRWEHPEHGLISPARFIPVAEDTGAIVELGEWVLREACGQVADWTNALGADRLVLSVNLSRRQLDDPGIVSVVQDVLGDTGLDPGRLCLEITETAVMRDFELSVRVLSAHRTLGVRLAIDDFGVGFSSLSQLKHLPPIDLLKIDKSFVDGITVGADDRAIVAAILSLARALDITAIAEGVERSEQVDALATLGCELAQGYHYFRPQPPAGLDAVLREHVPTGSASPMLPFG